MSPPGSKSQLLIFKAMEEPLSIETKLNGDH